MPLNPNQDQLDQKWMLRAIELSKNGFPAPNPHVGCVIVDAEQQVVGEGWHEYWGGPHAEVVALQNAGQKTKGSTVYCTLEPCNHTGRTGPCSLALIEAGVRRVVYSVSDPNAVASGGKERMQKARIEVQSGFLEPQARRENLQFLFSTAANRPMVTLKMAITSDGRINQKPGERTQISGAWSKNYTDRLRTEAGSVLVGRKTIEIDHAELTVRAFDVHHQPIRIVIDPHQRLRDRQFPILSDSAPTLIVSIYSEFSESFQMDSNESLKLQWDKLLRQLFSGNHAASRPIRGVLVEGGAETADSILQAGFVDRLIFYVSPQKLPEGQFWNQRIPLDFNSAFNVLEKSGSTSSPDFLFEIAKVLSPVLSLSPTFSIQSVEKIENDLRIILDSRNIVEFLSF